MATETTNYKFKKPDATDFYDIEVLNENFDKVDEAMKELKEVQPDWNETNEESDSYIKNKPSIVSIGLIYEGDMSSVNTYKLNTSCLGFSYVEFMGKDSNGGVWSEKINPIDFLSGPAFSVHGIKFSGVGSGPNITVTQNTSDSSIYKIIGIKD